MNAVFMAGMLPRYVSYGDHHIKEVGELQRTPFLSVAWILEMASGRSYSASVSYPFTDQAYEESTFAAPGANVVSNS